MYQDQRTQKSHHLISKSLIIDQLTQQRDSKIIIHQQIKSNPLDAILSMIEEVLSDQYLYKDQNFARVLVENPKGYIKISVLLKVPIIQKYMKRLEQQQQFGTSYLEPNLILKAIREKSNKLIANKVSVRRIIPFINKYSSLKPVYVQGFSNQEIRAPQQLQNKLSCYTNILKVKLKNQYAFVKAQEPQKLINADGQRIGWRKPLIVQSYSQISRQIDQLNNTRVYANIQKIYEEQQSAIDEEDQEFQQRDQSRYYEILEMRRNNRQKQMKSKQPNYDQNCVLLKLSIKFKAFAQLLKQ